MKLKKILSTLIISGALLLSAQPVFAAYESEPNDELETAQVINLNTLYEATFSAPSDRDWFQFTIPSNGDYYIVSSKPSGTNFYIIPWKYNNATGEWVNVFSTIEHAPTRTHDVIVLRDVKAGDRFAYQVYNHSSSTNVPYYTYFES
ncbi:hypothetical protein ACJ7K1_01085 [Paenibacillus elgii]